MTDNASRAVIDEIKSSKLKLRQYDQLWKQAISEKRAQGSTIRKGRLYLPSAIRWLGITEMIINLLRSRDIFFRMASNPDISQNWRDTISDYSGFYRKLEDTLRIVKPISD